MICFWELIIWAIGGVYWWELWGKFFSVGNGGIWCQLFFFQLVFDYESVAFCVVVTDENAPHAGDEFFEEGHKS